jgi:hypothetical protein
MNGKTANVLISSPHRIGGIEEHLGPHGLSAQLNITTSTQRDRVLRQACDGNTVAGRTRGSFPLSDLLKPVA